MKDFDSNFIEKQIGYTFKNKDLLKQAFTHSSFSNENKAESYERLEFLGDAVLNFVIAEELYRKFPDINEGELTTSRAKLVSGNSLSKIIQTMNIMDYVRVGKGSINETKTSNNVQCDIFESIAGAILVDNNWDNACCKDFILRSFNEKISNVTNKATVDFKTKLKEKCDKKGESLQYEYTKQDNIFSAVIIIGGNKVATGEGHAKIDAAQAAAKNYLDNK